MNVFSIFSSSWIVALRMPVARYFHVNLRRLILLLAIISVLITLANSFHASYRVQRQLLIDNTLESNRAYAAKLASSTEDFLQSAQQQLAYSAGLLAGRFEDTALLTAEVERLRLQTSTFNSVLVTDALGWVHSVSPDTLPIMDRPLDSFGALQALREQRPLISQPYISVAGNLLILISHPITNSSGRYLGYIGGSIYLKQPNILHNLLDQHYYQDSSYLYVVDQSRQLLYHPDVARLGQQVNGNPVIATVLRGESGSQRLHNSLGIDMLAGYASVPAAGWGLVAQRPTHATLAPLNELMLRVLRNTLPMTLLTLLFIWWCARMIARPLRKLAHGAREMDTPAISSRIKAVHAWYFESAELKRALLIGISLLQHKIGKLNQDVQTDPLTGLHNRRGLRRALDLWQAEQRPFAAVALDIDHFKQVNDTYGHDVGDVVIQGLAELMRNGSRAHDELCRVGGEEFLMLLPDATPEAAEQIAERLRQQVEQTVIEPAGPITISLGVAHWPAHAATISEVLKAADQRLYQAKHSGRNRVVTASNTTIFAATEQHSDSTV
jgi:diguanylate cyclase (GGDEF)-like protein